MSLSTNSIICRIPTIGNGRSARDWLGDWVMYSLEGISCFLGVGRADTDITWACDGKELIPWSVLRDYGFGASQFRQH